MPNTNDTTTVDGLTPAQQVDALNKLITGCNDDGRVYQRAAFRASSREHQRLLFGLSQRRSEFALELGKLVTGLGGAPNVGGSVLGLLRGTFRSWLMTGEGNIDRDGFRECARTEARVYRLYMRALQDTWPADTRLVLGAQRDAVESGHRQMHTLKCFTDPSQNDATVRERRPTVIPS